MLENCGRAKNHQESSRIVKKYKNKIQNLRIDKKAKITYSNTFLLLKTTTADLRKPG